MEKEQLELAFQADRISKELKELSTKLEGEGVRNFHNIARSEINKKYGKFWRERLTPLSNEKIKMNYY